MELSLSGSYSQEALKIATAVGISVYDASYISIGKLRGLDVYTTDEELLRKVGKFEFVKHVKDYTGPG